MSETAMVSPASNSNSVPAHPAKAHIGPANLDVLRAIAVLCVFVDHLLGAQPGIDYSKNSFLGFLGGLGVAMFFVHTSVVLMMSLARSRGTSIVRSFYVRRAFRIYPLCIACVIVVVTCDVPAGIHGSFQNPSLRILLSNLSLTQNLFYQPVVLGPLWLCQLKCRCISCCLFYLCSRKNIGRRLILSLIWIISIGIGMIQPHVSARLGVLWYAPCFLSGVLAYCLPIRLQLPAWLWPGAIAALCRSTSQTAHKPVGYFASPSGSRCRTSAK